MIALNCSDDSYSVGVCVLMRCWKLSPNICCPSSQEHVEQTTMFIHHHAKLDAWGYCMQPLHQNHSLNRVFCTLYEANQNVKMCCLYP